LIVVGVGWDGRRGHVLWCGTAKRLLGWNGLLSLDNFFNTDSLELSFPLDFLAFDGLVVSEMFDILSVVVSVV
jgi:hypothetical protein